MTAEKKMIDLIINTCLYLFSFSSLYCVMNKSRFRGQREGKNSLDMIVCMHKVSDNHQMVTLHLYEYMDAQIEIDLQGPRFGSLLASSIQ